MADDRASRPKWVHAARRIHATRAFTCRLGDRRPHHGLQTTTMHMRERTLPCVFELTAGVEPLVVLLLADAIDAFAAAIARPVAEWGPSRQGAQAAHPAGASRGMSLRFKRSAREGAARAIRDAGGCNEQPRLSARSDAW